MRRLVCLAALALVAVAPTGASAKGPLHARICGAAGCASTLLDGFGFFPERGSSRVLPAPRSPRFLTVELTSPGSAWMHYRYRYVPAQRLLRVSYGNGNAPFWRSAPESVVRALAPYVRRLGLKA
jgi:hypothetical protein